MPNYESLAAMTDQVSPREPATPAEIWVIEDHARLRLTVCEALTAANVGQARGFATCEPALAALGRADDESARPPDVILLDLGLPGMGGVAGLSRFKALAPEAEIIVFTICDDDARVLECIRAGASGYLLKSEPLERIVAAVEEVRRGGAPLTPEIARSVLDFVGRPPEASPGDPLSEREREVLGLVADGLTKRQIALRLGLSQHTVDNYIRRIYAKLHVNSLGAAVARGLHRP
jgi:DNA-binding NarL/FixJ family response regulator